MKFNTAKFIKSAKVPKDFPDSSMPEFAFFGRSNTGKSSLLNMITGRKDLVKTGSRPGMTQLINFFTVDDQVSFADLPGFGFAKVPAEIRKGFMPMIREYASARKNLKLAFLLVDIRRIPGDMELELLEYLTGMGIPVAVILTKCDKVSGNERVKNLKNISEALELDQDAFFLSSSLKGTGKKELRQLIHETAFGRDSSRV